MVRRRPQPAGSRRFLRAKSRERGHGWLFAAALAPGVPAPPRMLAACGMQRCHQEALKKNRVMLAKQLVLNVLVEHMVEKDIITTEMVEMIQVRGLSPAP